MQANAIWFMKSLLIRIGLLFFILILLMNCAKRGRPEGGPRDIEPPKITKASPDLNSTNFKTKKIRISFNEYIKLDDPQKQLIISPPLKQFPRIKPQGSANKYIEITIEDTLKENTTYVFNFGQSIKDNNEGNAFQNFKYVFSTGDYIDSLKLYGNISSAKDKTPDNFVSVMLYAVDSTFTDSIIYKTPPTYITNTLDSTTTFELSNLKAGKYLLVAMKDVASNNLFNQKTDKIAFLKDYINIPTDSVFNLKLFKEVNEYRAYSPILAAKNKIIFGYEGDGEDIKITLLSDVPDEYDFKITKERDKDSLNYWFTPFEADSLIFKVSHPFKTDTFNLKIKDLYKDSLLLTPKSRSAANFDLPYIIEANTPLVNHDKDKIQLLDKDSTTITFENIGIDTLNNSLNLKWEVQPEQNYNLLLLPGAVEDFFGNTNDTITYRLRSRAYSDLASITVTLQQIPNHSLIVQLVDNSGKLAKEIYGSPGQTLFDFRYLEPGEYDLKVIFDANENGKWDTGSYLEKRQPERIAYYPEPIVLRANWDRPTQFILN